MALELLFSFDPSDLLLFVGFAPGGGELKSPEDVDRFERALEVQCQPLQKRVHLFFDLENLAVPSDLIERFANRKRLLCERFALSSWHFGGHLAERVMTRNDFTRRGAKPNLFRNRDDAVAAFRKARLYAAL